MLEASNNSKNLMLSIILMTIKMTSLITKIQRENLEDQGEQLKVTQTMNQ